MIFEKLGVMIDCSRNSVMNISALKKLIDMLSAMGYNTLQLYTEDTCEVNNEPYFGYLRGRYSKPELKEIDAYAKGKGIELIPCIQTLAHLNQIFRWEPYRNIRDCDDILLAGEERTYELIDNIFSTLAECFTSRRVNIGMDEAHMLGLGKYLYKHGYKNRYDIMLGHLERVVKTADKYGFKCAMWSDMFFNANLDAYFTGGGEISEEIKKRVPKNVTLIYWEYGALNKEHYDLRLNRHKELENNIIFAGGAQTWHGLVPHNGYAIEAAKAAFASCREHGVKEAFLTMWGDNGGSCSPFSALPALFAAAELAKGNTGENEIRRKFEAFSGVPFNVFMYADLPNISSPNRPLTAISNPSKYLFYNDCLLGIFDAAVGEGAGVIYKNHASKLRKAEKYAEWAFLFKPLRLLCEALYYKADLGLRTREIYRAVDRAGTAALVASSYKPLIKKVKEFYNAFLIYWDTLYKPHGFDVMDIRLGGVLLRLEHVMDKLSGFAQGKTDKIEELDEEILDLSGGGNARNKTEALYHNWFGGIVTVNIL